MSDFKGENNPRWNGGRAKHSAGYILVRVPTHPHAENRGYVREHRLVMEKHIGRYLKPEEDVHHLDHDKTNNNISNLELFPDRASHLRKYHREDGKATWFQKGQTPHNKYLVPKPCGKCGQMFQPRSADKKYCSSACYWETKKGIEPIQLRRARHGANT